MDAFVLDCHPDPVANEMVLWLKDRDTGEVLARRYDAAATFYAAPRHDLDALDDLEADSPICAGAAPGSRSSRSSSGHQARRGRPCPAPASRNSAWSRPA